MKKGEKMKKNIAIIVLTVGLIISLFLNYQLKGYKEVQQRDYNLKLNHGLQIGIKQSIENVDYVLKSLQNNSSKETVLYTLGNLAVSLKVGEEAFIFLNADFQELGSSSSNLIYSVFRDFYGYVRADLSDDIVSNQQSLEQDSRSQLVKDIEILKKDLEYIDSQFNEQVLKDRSPEWIEDKWKELIAEIVNRNPNFKLYERMKLKYNF
ncbi:oxidoreductase [Paenibacillus silvae]|uniref:oxidoreductase n=2 Tax=Paenibacillus silvae TaxID=1325358 RepID=UPI0020055E1B|nr:oxidoreductase [Paenibacillus silvae]